MPSWVSDVSPASSSDGDAAEASPFASVASVPISGSVVATHSLEKDDDVARMDRKRGDREAEGEEEDAEDNFTGA